MDSKITVKIATPVDQPSVLKLVAANALKLGQSAEKFEFAANYILKDINYGFFVLAESEGEPAGFMLFTYEWSDWRNGLFFWLQSVHYTETAVFTHMHRFLEGYMKERGSCGVRVYYPKEEKAQWGTVVGELGLKESHYYIFHVGKE